MQIFIIGNGFDKGHGLPTGCTDFRRFLDKYYPEFLSAFETYYSIPDTDIWWGKIEDYLSDIDEDVIIGYAESVEFDLDVTGEEDFGDTLEYAFKEKFAYIDQLAAYLKCWIQTIDISGASRHTTMINPDLEAAYITFNYTELLERLYLIDPARIFHIHGSIIEGDMDPVIGHGDSCKIFVTEEELFRAQNKSMRRRVDALETVRRYLKTTYKETSHYMNNLQAFASRWTDVDVVHVIGHSVSRVDQGYFSVIDKITEKKARWDVYYFDDADEVMTHILDCGIDNERIRIIDSKNFYDLK